MININSPTVQTIIQSNGYNPFMNNQYIPQQQYQQPIPIYQGYNTYNPYLANQMKKSQNDLDNWNYSYDPMPNVIVNENRGIRSVVKPTGTMVYNNGYNQFNNIAFNGYINPILQRNQEEQRMIAEREEAIKQGKIWRRFLQNVKLEDDDLDIDDAVKTIESYYYQEPQKQDITIKDKVIIDKNRHIAEIESRLSYYRENNIPIMTPHMMNRSNVYGYYNHINSIIGDANNCDMFDYFTRVYPELKFEQLSAEVDKFNKNLKNRYNSEDFNKLINKVSADRADSYYQKLMESFAEDGVKLETSNGLVITADQMEVKLPESLLRKRKNKQDLYYEQRKKFYDSVFKKES